MRLAYYDNVKFLLIVLVVIGHFIDVCGVGAHQLANAAFVFIYSFHMPLFIFVSGLFVNAGVLTAEKTVSRCVFFVVLGFSAKLIMHSVPVLFGAPMRFSLLSESHLPWFMFALAAYYALAFLLRCMDMRTILVFSVALGLFVGYDETIGDFMVLSRIIVFAPFFWFGCCLSPDSVERATAKLSFRVVAIVVVLVFAATCIAFTNDIYAFRGLFTGRNCFRDVAIQDCSCLHRFAAYAISGFVCAGVMGIIPHTRIPFVTEWGQRTIQIYLLHFPAIRLCQYTGVVDAIMSLPGSGWMLALLLGIMVTLALTPRFLGVPIDALSRACSARNSP